MLNRGRRESELVCVKDPVAPENITWGFPSFAATRADRLNNDSDDDEGNDEDGDRDGLDRCLWPVPPCKKEQ